MGVVGGVVVDFAEIVGTECGNAKKWVWPRNFRALCARVSSSVLHPLLTRLATMIII